MKLCGYDWPQGGTKQVVFVDDRGHVIELEMGLDIPWQSADLTELTGAPPPAGTAFVGYAWSAGGTKQIAYVDGQGHVIELVVAAGNSWQWKDLTELTGAPPPDGTVLAGYDWYNGKTKQVAYVDNRRHVIELFVASGNPWQWADLTELTEAPLPCDSTLVGYNWSRGDTKQVVYVDDQGHVIELFVASGNPWQWVDLTELTEAPPPAGTALVGYAWSAGGTKQVAYVDNRRHVIELLVAAGNPWQWADLTELTGAPLAVQESLTGYDWLNGNTKQVAYVDDQGHVIELLVAVGNPWQCTDLTERTGAPQHHQKPLSGYGYVWGATKQVVYADDQGQVIELWGALGGQWHYAILLKSAERNLIGAFGKFVQENEGRSIGAGRDQSAPTTSQD